MPQSRFFPLYQGVRRWQRNRVDRETEYPEKWLIFVVRNYKLSHLVVIQNLSFNYKAVTWDLLATEPLVRKEYGYVIKKKKDQEKLVLK